MQRRKEMEDEISHKIIGAAIEVHKVLGGPGLLEGVLAVPVNYKGTAVRDPLYIDILVQGSVIVEVKATEKLHSIHQVQLLTYLRLLRRKLGLLVNFGQEYVKDGISRVVNGL